MDRLPVDDTHGQSMVSEPTALQIRCNRNRIKRANYLKKLKK